MKASERGVLVGSTGRGRKMSLVQEIMLRSTDYLRRIIAPVGGQGGVTMSYLCPTATVSLWKTTFGGPLRENPPSGGAQIVEKTTIGGNRTGF